jgi:hypothetical protein
MLKANTQIRDTIFDPLWFLLENIADLSLKIEFCE